MTVEGTVNLILCNNTTLTANEGIEIKDGAILSIWVQSFGCKMGKLVAKASGGNAGIDGSEKSKAGTVQINGGNIEATGGSDGEKGGAGIGGGKGEDATGIYIKGGKVTANGNDGGAGIGGGAVGHCTNVTITGGTVRAASFGEGGAGIGAGNLACLQGTIKISGRKTDVKAWGGDLGAGIGAGNVGDAHTGRVEITGGNIEAIGGKDAAGIGGGCGNNANGQGGRGATVVISGKTEIIAEAGNDNAVAIGNGAGCKEKGKLTIADSLMVTASRKGVKNGDVYKAEFREEACQEHAYSWIQVCDHPDPTYGHITDKTHTQNPCINCNTTFKAEAHVFDKVTKKCKCGYIKGQVTVTFKANGGQGKMGKQTMLPDKSDRLTANAFTWEGHTFKGWNTKADGSGKSYADGAKVKPGSNITLYAQWYTNVTIVAHSRRVRWTGKPVTVEGYRVMLADNSYVKNVFFKGVSAGRTETEMGVYEVKVKGVTINKTTDLSGKYLVTGVRDGALFILKAEATFAVSPMPHRAPR